MPRLPCLPRVHEFTSAATPKKKQNQAGYSNIRPSFPSSLPADLARMTMVWLEPTIPSFALAPINPIKPSGRSAPARPANKKDAATGILGSCLSSVPTPRQTAAADAHNGEVTMGGTLSARFLPLFSLSCRSLQLEKMISRSCRQSFQIVPPYRLPYSTRSTQYHTLHAPVRPEQRACSWGGIAGRS